MGKTHVFVDGFNLYYGSLRGTNYKWLNVLRMSQVLLKRASIEKIFYFTARVKPRVDDPTQNSRQDTYIRALGTLGCVEVVYGHFLSHPTRMPGCNSNSSLTGVYHRVLKTEEKGSDVNLASYLLRGAFRGEYEQAVLVTNDSDLQTPVKMLKEDFGLRVGILNPHDKPSRVLIESSDFVRRIRPGVLRTSQFPPQLSDENGTFRKPSEW